MATSPIGINSPAERELDGVGDPVDDRLGLDLEERHAAEAWGVEGPGHRALLEQHRRRCHGRVSVGRWTGAQCIPPHGTKTRTPVLVSQTPVLTCGKRGARPNTTAIGYAVPGLKISPGGIPCETGRLKSLG